MGLDISFYTNNDDAILDLRNHGDLFNRLLEQPHTTIGEYTDFHVTPDMLEAVLEGVEDDMEEAGMHLPVLKEETPDTPEAMLQGLPHGFCDEEPHDWRKALPHCPIPFLSKDVPLALSGQGGPALAASAAIVAWYFSSAAVPRKSVW